MCLTFCLLSQLPQIHLYGIFQPIVKRVADERMPNAYLVKFGDAVGKIFQVLQVKVVAGINAKAGFVRCFCSLYIGHNCQSPVIIILACIPFSVKLNTVGAGCGCR